jgi:glycerol-3-phosphate dehydrogenase
VWPTLQAKAAVCFVSHVLFADHKVLLCCELLCAKAARLPFAFQILYYDGQFDDARLNVALATTAAAAGAAVANYVEATGLIKVGWGCC